MQFYKYLVLLTLGVTTLELKFPKTPVPDKETNYYCMLFELPTDKDYHIIADQPILDNRYTIHHMLLYACPAGSRSIPFQPRGLEYSSLPY